MSSSVPFLVLYLSVNVSLSMWGKIFICGEIGSLVVSKIPTNCGDFDLWEIVCGDLTNGPNGLHLYHILIFELITKPLRGSYKNL